ncbi:MAG: CoA pyrophosphatase, partial [Alphaproteobacteria bacterium]|nr:CoA pyrophosphatase [Alphaproteobacteria bacterium]
MSLADTLREALALGHQRQVVLLEGDVMEPGGGGEPLPAAVLVPVVDRPEPTVILTERPMTMRKHPGQISFPGGRIDPGDDGPIAAALREAHEEIGLPPACVEVIGIADVYRTITGFQVTPIVGVLPPNLDLRPHPSEVSDMFEAPLRFLLDPARHEIRSAIYQGRERHY